ncbi:glycosyltransferase family 4 protein [Opitutus sp. ER46]|uniref:glycosyltransferase family 4 protein n=1 Tax=Opitutus sp. ER46 TaxID=2161864 RepID=UPI000D324821|nr:glycosyltransferase family 4 protein [Opitutus sp. ER46]PTX90734.1 glycosyltransferase family 1 protein [Opitutus sp. ER46]
MRLLFVHERFGALGGAEANVLVTARELKRRGHTLAVLHGPSTGREIASWQETFGERYALPPHGGTPAARAALAAFRADVVFVHKLSDLDALDGLTAGAAPVVRMIHDHDLYCMRGYRYHPLTREICTRPASGYCMFPCGAMLARNRAGGFPVQWVSYTARQREIALTRRCARVIVASEYMREELRRNGFTSAQIEIHAPVPAPAVAGIAPSFGPRNRLVYAGQIIRGKGVDVLLEALARVREVFDCVIVGDGSHRAHCGALCRRLGLADRVRFTGFMPQAEIAAHYQEASVALMSSVWPEPFGAVGLEAMRYGLPVVAFDAGAIREWLLDGWNGFLVPWMDRDRYAAGIEELLRDKPLARRMGEHGREWVGARFGFPKYINGLEALFSALGGKHASSAPAPILA